MASAKSLSARKLDLAFFIYFVIHLPVMFLNDLVPFYPKSLAPSICVKIHDWYLAHYHDQLFIHPTPWFDAYLTLELVYHVPTTLWMLIALPTDHPLVPLHLLIYGMEVAITTLTCFVDMLHWQHFSYQEKWNLGIPYGLYLVFAVIMGSTGFLRLRAALLQKVKAN